MSEYIDKDDLMALRQLKAKMEYDFLASENAVLKSQVSDLNYQNSVLKIYIKYGIRSDDGLDYKDGKIIKKEEKESQESNERKNDIQSQGDSRTV